MTQGIKAAEQEDDDSKQQEAFLLKGLSRDGTLDSQRLGLTGFTLSTTLMDRVMGLMWAHWEVCQFFVWLSQAAQAMLTNRAFNSACA